ncbi:phosphate regulon transcriptional regulator PhoB [Immundisolibacter cernigliae]|uniref:Phosphate regulon transcriptional regulatory protein PhoB n=1 Tax=Immundisolibacter cernigliae TaxID=1810504 RepID=A0A1B1YU20_9GAMM|nr:phosphate regulon transcriptional regulator PhoB [Immundisolibacter cernigliae]ANX04275.1 DNA-binding response regulator [Immundisolibacter cernigliae]
MPIRILIVEDEPAICEMLTFALSDSGYRCDVATDVRAARSLVADSNPDLIVLDWMLPGQSGIEFARELKRDPGTRDIPVIMLTARTQEADVVTGLDAGADDYIPKPFSPRELAARIKAVLRRASPHAAGEELAVDGLRLDPVDHRVVSGEGELKIGPTEFRLLQFLMAHPDRVYSRSQLIDQVWGRNVYIEERTVDVHVRRLREALSPAGKDRLIQTVRGAGYRLSAKG